MINSADAQRSLNRYGWSALGLAGTRLALKWATAQPSYDRGQLTLSPGGAVPWRSPFSGTLGNYPNGVPDLYALDGRSIGTKTRVVRLHPQSHLRLERLIAVRLGGDGAHSWRPVPVAISIRETTIPDTAIEEVKAGQLLDSGTLAFHDARGLIIDPAAVAAWFADLLQDGAFVDLREDGSATADLSADGGLLSIAGLGSGTRIHVVTPHGGPWHDPGSGHGLTVQSGGGSTRVTGAGPFDFPTGASLTSEEATPVSVRWGLATNGSLGTVALSVPAFPTTPGPARSLNCDFLRICAVDLTMHLLGNRTTSPVDGVGKADSVAADEPPPAVREGMNISGYVDGVGVLGRLREIIRGLPTGPGSSFEGYLVSPAIDDTVVLPQGTTAGARWPQFPPFAAPGAWDASKAGRLRKDGITAAWIGSSGPDILLTVDAGLLPAGAYVRIYPRLFVTGPSLPDSPTLFRGDGDAGTAPATGSFQLVLHDPLGLGSHPRPATPRLHFDLLVVPRPAGSPPRERLIGGLNIPVQSTPATAPGVPPRAQTLIPSLPHGISSSPLLGLPPRPGPKFSLASAADILAAVLQLGGESQPRESPRLPTMARYDTIAAFRNGPNSSDPWNAILTGGFLQDESTTAAYRLGNPGYGAHPDHSSGPEIHAAGLSVDGQLGYDLGLAAMRRSEPLVPLSSLMARIVDLDGDGWNVPPASTASTLAAAALQTVAPYCETPELSLYAGDLHALPDTWKELTDPITKWIKDNTGITVTFPPSVNHDRVIKEVKREFWAAKYGRRDYQWSLRRAITKARELIYIEAPQFAATAYGGGDEAWDIVAELVQRMQAQRGLRVIIALPRGIAFGRQYGGWMQQEYDARTAALAKLRAVADPGITGQDLLPDEDISKVQNTRVAAFHPIGFPGRPLNIRTTVVIVDDVWCSIGTSVPRRRGLTFDGGEDVVLFDKQMTGGYSSWIRTFRRNLMALHLGTGPGQPGGTPDQRWVRLAQPVAAFNCVRELLAHGGNGLIVPIWPGPAAGTVLPQPSDVADPDGRHLDALMAMLVAGLADLESVPAS